MAIEIQKSEPWQQLLQQQQLQQQSETEVADLVTYHESDPPRGQGGFLRLKQVLELIPVSPSSWWNGVRRGKYPKSVKLSRRTTVWYRSDIEQFIANAGKAEMAPWVIRRKTRSLAGAPADPADQGG